VEKWLEARGNYTCGRGGTLTGKTAKGVKSEPGKVAASKRAESSHTRGKDSQTSAQGKAISAHREGKDNLPDLQRGTANTQGNKPGIFQ